MSSEHLTERKTWKALKAHHQALAGARIDALFAQDKTRFENFHLTLDGLLFDYSKNLLTDETISLLAALAQSCGLDKWRKAMREGETINATENRAVLHMALRGSADETLEIDGENVSAFVRKTLSQIKNISETVRSENKFTDIVNIGIGGSDLGPHMVYEALAPFADGPRAHFVSNIDGAHLSQTLAKLNPDTTLFIVASKTFTTLETLGNAQAAKDWLEKTQGAKAAARHFIAVTSNAKGAQDFGIAPDNILPLRDWIGGRYSVWGAIGLPIAIALGFENFEKFLSGAREADAHFLSATPEKNIPVLMAMIGIWHRNFCEYPALAILPYAQNLEHFAPYIQQLDMESNGKSVDRQGTPVDHATGPVIFGAPGTNGQHAFFQLLHQGTDIVPCDFIAAARAHHNLPGHHTKLLANALAQSEALMRGQENTSEPHRAFHGNRPSSTFLLPELDPYYLGMLMAFYEHKIFVQGIVWNINSFDQWGVELGKTLAKDLTGALENGGGAKNYSASTNGLLNYLANSGT